MRLNLTQNTYQTNITYNNCKFSTEVQLYLNELSSAKMKFPSLTEINIIESLKKLKRTGKAIRLKDYKELGIKTRSVYDHIISLARLADVLFELDNKHFVHEENITNLGRIITYHDINEILLGDIPNFTCIEDKLQNRLHQIGSIEREKRANNFIWMFLNDQQRKSIETINFYLDNEQTHVMQFFTMLDKIDPIIAIWRYLYHYREILSPHCDKFIHSMDDFFANPKALKYRDNHEFTDKFPYTKILLECLCNPDHAKEYVKNNKISLDNEEYYNVFKYLIEQTPLFHEDMHAEKLY